MSQFLTGLAQLNPQVKRHNGGTSTLTLDQNGTTNSTLLFINGVAQSPGTDFSVSGATLTTTSALPAGTNIATTIQYFNTGIVNTVADDAIGLAQMASGTDGNIISYDASGNPVAVATGSDGQVLTSAGAGAPPAFETAASPDSVLISTTTASSSADFDIDLDNSTYSTYQFILERVVPATDNVSMRIRTSSDGGASFDATGGHYLFGANFNIQGIAHGGISGSSETSLIIPEVYQNMGSATGEGLSGQFWVYGAGLTNAYTYMTGHFSFASSSANATNFIIGGHRLSVADVDAVQFIMTSGAMESGRIKLYGYK
jgi:hypothetical protein